MASRIGQLRQSRDVASKKGAADLDPVFLVKESNEINGGKKRPAKRKAGTRSTRKGVSRRK